MKTITEISEQKNNPKRCNLYLDGEFFAGVELFTILSNRLKKGMTISEDELKKLIDESEYTKGLTAATGYIAKGLKTKMQVIMFLKKKGYEGYVIAKIIDKLIEYDYINDETYAKTYANIKKNSKGKRLIAVELKRKGVAGDTVENVMENAASEDNGAYQIAEKFLRGKEIDYDAITKCYRRLLSRGFDYDTAKSVVERVKRENEITED